MSIRLILKEMRVNRLDVGRDSLTLVFSSDTKMDPQRLVSLAGQDPRRFQFLSENKFKVKTGRLSPPDDLPKIEKAIQAIHLH